MLLFVLVAGCQSQRQRRSVGVYGQVVAAAGAAQERARDLLAPFLASTSDASTNPSNAYEAACTAFTQDHKVFAVAVILSSVTPNFFECLRKHGVLAVSAIWFWLVRKQEGSV